MVGNSMFNIQINNRRKDIKGGHLPFVTVSIVAIGDLFQLEPVIDGYIFRDLDNSEYSILAPNLCQEHVRMFELHEIMRQRESKMFAQMLNRLREGKHNCQDIMKFEERLIDSNGTEYLDIPCLFIQNAKVNKTEFTMLCLVLSTQSKHMTLSLELNLTLSEKKILKDIKILNLAVGERTDISINIRTHDGLTNGAANTVKLIQLQQTGEKIKLNVFLKKINEWPYI